MTKFLGALAILLSLSLFGGSALSAFEPAPSVVTQDGDKGKKKGGKKKHKKKQGNKKQGKKKHHGKKKGKNGKK